MNYAENMRIFLLIISFLCLTTTVAAKDVYRYVDEQGNVIYTDTPITGAEKIRLDEIQTIDSGDVPEFKYTPPPREVLTYSKLEIVSPAQDTVLQGEDNNVSVSGVVEPALNLKAGHYFVLYLDGNEAASGTSPQFMLTGLERGTHTLNLAIVDQAGSQVISSPGVAFTIYQHSALHPQSTVGKPPPPPPPPPKPPVIP